MSLLTLSNFTLQIITSMKFSFKFLYSFGPTHAKKIETEVILQHLTTSVIVNHSHGVLLDIILHWQPILENSSTTLFL